MARPKRLPPGDPPPGNRLAFKAPGAHPPVRRVPPTARPAPARPPRTVPTRLVKFFVGVLLLPVCWVASQTCFSAFARATIHGHFWASVEFYHFALGVLVWTLAFFLLPKPLLIYVFGHELTHALWVLAMGGRVSEFKVGRNGGYIIADRRDFLVSLAPYFFPLYSLAAIVLFGGAGLFYPVVWHYQKYLFMVVGMTWAFHFSFTCWMIPKKQTDLLLHGTFFSLIVIYLANLLVLTIFFVVACPQVTWAGLGKELLRNTEDFSDWACREAGVHPAGWLPHARRH